MAVKRQKQEEAVDTDANIMDVPPPGGESETNEAGVTTTVGEEEKSREESLAETQESMPAATEQPTAPSVTDVDAEAKGEAATTIASEANPQEQTSAVQEQLDAPLKQSAAPPVKDVRYKSLFQTKPAETKADEMADTAGTAIPEASVHPPTRALYIRNFMRPLQPPTLRRHLAKVATPSGSEPDESIVELFHLDQVRTHAFVLFKTLEAADRTRNALHGRVFPAERDRKQLWADFIPENNVQQWIDIELNDDGGGRTNGRRWEVEYMTNDEGTVEVSLSEIFTEGRIAPARRDSQPAVKGILGAPTGPRMQARSNSGAFDAAAPLRRTSLGGVDTTSKPSSSESNSLPVAARGPNTDVAFQKMGSLVSSSSSSEPFK
jgi:hypothetical protein